MADGILYIQEQHPNSTETFVRAEIAELLQRSYDVNVLTLSCNKSLAELCGYQSNIHEVSFSPGDAVRALVERTRDFAPRYLHTHFATEALKYTAQVAGALNIPYGFTVHAYDLWLRGARVEPEVLKQISNSDLCVTVAAEGTRHRDYLLLCGVPSEKIIITPNSVDRSRLPKSRNVIPDSLRQVVMIGRPVPKKGFFVAIDAFRLLQLSGYQDMRLMIVGGEDNSRPLGQEVKAYADHFPFVDTRPLLSHKEALQIIAQSDALLMPSIIAENGDSDGIPTVLAEAMLLKVPVVSTDVGSITDLVVHEETGFIARSGDPASLASALIQLDRKLKKRDEAERFLESAYKRALQQEIQSSVNVLAAHLEKQLGRM